MKKMLCLFCLYWLALPALAYEVEIFPQKAYQGKCFSFRLLSAEGVAKAELEFLDKKIALYGEGTEFKGILGVLPEQKPGEYELKLTITRQNGEKENNKYNIKIGKSRFESTWFRLKPAKKKLFVRDLIAEEWAKIEKVLVVEDVGRYWNGSFLLPAEGPTSMPFGTIEHINGKRTGQHRGHDIAVPTGTEVRAAETGKIVFAQKLKAFGGTIVIDHGQGIHTLYFHLSRFLKEVGELVREGDIIALSGNSGISSGPHLHWGLSVHNLRVDPMQWTRYAF